MLPTLAPPPVATADARYQLLFNSIDEGFCIVEVLFDGAGQACDYRFNEVNPSFERHTGLSSVIGRRMRDLAADHEERWFRIYGEVARSGQATRFEARAEALGRWYDVYAFRVGEVGENLVAILFSDISERKRFETALQEADRRKDEFIAILAHELRNPMAPLRNALQIMKLAHGDAALVERSRQLMERQVDHMVTLVDQLMDVSRISRGLVVIERRRVDLNDVVHAAIEAAEPLIRQRGHRLTLQLPPARVMVDADATRLTQALGNLLLNAAKYTDPGGRITVALTSEGDSAVLSVTDTGIGIPQAMLDKVFDLFTQVPSADRAQGGLGIGLALVKQIAAMHGGTVQAASEGHGHGSRFTLRLPLLVQAEPALPPAPAPAAAAGAAGRRVLVADDSPDTAESLAMLLRLDGHDVQVVGDGEQAVEAAQRLHPDVVLLDIGMPRLDGVAAAQRIRDDPAVRGATLVAITGWGQEADRFAIQGAGFDHHLIKPVRLEALQAILAATPAAQR